MSEGGAPEADRRRIVGRWVHVREEDSGGSRVFRPGDHPLPPSRGRRSYSFRSDGTLEERVPGPVDAPVTRRGRWSIGADGILVLFLEGKESRWRIDLADPQRLLMRG